MPLLAPKFQSVVEDSSRRGTDRSAWILFVKSDISIVMKLFNFSGQQYLGILPNLIFGKIVLNDYPLV